MKNRLKILLFLIIAMLAGKSYALDLGIPVACVYGEDCFIESYYDHDAKKDKFADHTCGKLSDDNHYSTDFKLRNYAQMKDGVNVVAGDSGVVKYARDGMSDISVDLIGEEAVRGRECGNGVVITHSRGYETQYCHLKQGSVLVKPGDSVEKGQPIGQVGLSGITSFPYLEFTVRLNGNAVDPFTGEDPVSGETSVPCDSLDIYPLWDKQTEKKLKYISTALLSLGFSEKVPHAQGAREGKFGREKIKNDARLLVLWVDVFGVMGGDEMKLTITDPQGKILSRESRKFVSDRRHIFQFMGQKPESAKWQEGEYIGKVELLRKDNDEIEQVIDSSVVVEIYDPAKVVEEKQLKEKRKRRQE